MKTYTFLEKEHTKDIIYFEESFSFKAMFLGPLWFMCHRLWLLSSIIGVLYFIFFYIFLNGITSICGSIFIYCLLSLFISISASDWLQKSFIKNGYKFKDVVIASSLESALLKYVNHYKNFDHI